MHKDVEFELRKLQSEGYRVNYYPNTGNAGDSLINVGFYQMADNIGLDYRIIYRDDAIELNKDDAIVIGGGGAIVPEWNATPDFIKKIKNSVAKIVILPQSIRGVDDVMKTLSSNDVVFCRELPSYQYCKDLNLDFALYLSHDMAFNVNYDKLKMSPASSGDLSIKKMTRWVIIAYHKAIRSKLYKKLEAYRCDKEANQDLKIRRKMWNDLSSIARFGNRGIENSNYSAKIFLELIGLYDTIDSDRLHVVVGASLMQKNIIARPNSYYKVSGVVEQSLADYPTIKLIK